ncbi:hypothetical protein EB796_016823 [Bugula neritina]|uniref:SH3 domain-containing protein n=1 Tax=Bugula neritina TaxID=10212 RepID=A0A7J7JF61_BUGNE|nr:hypothetical protein EB796_016823 [Bugula neritina]
MPIIGRHIIIPLLVFGFTVAVQLHAQPLPTDTLSGSNAKLKACANKECSKPISLVKANEDYTPTKPGYLTFYRHEKINVFSHYLSPPFNKLWYGEVVGVKPVAQGLFPKNLVKELEVYANQPITVEEPGVDTAVPKASSDPDNTEDPSPPTNEKSSNDMPSEPVNTLSHMNTVPEADAVPETKKPEDSEFPPTTNTATPGDLADGADSDSDAQTASPDGDSPDPLEDISPTPPVDPSADKETLIQATPPVDADTKIDENTDAVDGDGEDAEEGETADGKVPSQDENLNKEISSESEKINQVNQKSDQSVGEKLQLNMQPKEDVGNENNLAEANEGLKEDEGDQVNLVEANKESKERDKSNLAEANQEQKEPSEVHDAEKTDSNLNDDGIKTSGEDAEKKPGEDTFQSEKEEAKEQDLKELKLTDKNLSDTKESESDDKLTEPLKSVLETKQTTSDQDAISIDKSDVDQSGTRTNTELNQDSTKIDEANEVLKEADSKQAEADQDSISNKMVEDQHSSDANQIKIDQDISEVDKSDSNDIKQDKISDEVSFENAKVIKTEQDQNLAHTKHTDSHNEAKFEHDAEKKSTTNKPQQLIKNQNEIPVDEGKEISNQLETNEDGKLDASLETSKETSEVNVNIDNKEAVKSKETVEAKKTEESQTEVDSTEKTDTTMQEPPLKEASHTEDIPKESDQKEVEPLQNSTHETKVLEKPNVDQKEIESEQSDSNQKIIEPKPNDVSNKQDKPEKDEFKQQTVENNSTINESLLPAEDKAEKSLQSSEQQGDVEEILSKAVSQDGDQLPKSDEQKPEIADPILNISDVENPETKPTESGETKSQDSSTITKENVHETSEYVQPKDSVSTNSASSQIM